MKAEIKLAKAQAKEQEKEAKRIIRENNRIFKKALKMNLPDNEPISDDDIVYDDSHIEKGVQSQHHGFVFENELRHKVFLIPTRSNDVNTHDISKNQNRFDAIENISIKTTGKKDICCGDIIRFYDYDFSDANTMIVGQYTQTTTHKKIDRIIEIKYDKKLHEVLFGTITRDELIAYVDMVKALPRGRISKSKRDEILSMKKELEKTHGMYIQISPKIDSGNQRRVQCRIRNVDDLVEKNPENLLSISTTGVVRGIAINTIIASYRRNRTARLR
ncbi:hypothetical protein NY2A_B542R [Paramecium bursaria Chlorella virus NY2A]|uniref:Uncharacterized protein B542R n=2 Tax=Chlorovirus TaxID=181083 RepID=A7IX67_PBCVN|nr:hypothetical protein NY2A_B542R [Paramecium bursaria Chlorella virus NY2A]ABT14941.2 hypothetical protein NY2A_B542R [Paramecium bursaria Chlorella virus NY2A]